MGRGTYIPPSRLKEGCFVTAGGRNNHSFDLLYGKTPEKTKPSSSATEKCGMPPQCPPTGGPRERCPFPDRVGEGTYPDLDELPPRTLRDRAYFSPTRTRLGLGFIFPAYVYSLARRILSTGVWRIGLCYRMRSEQHDIHPFGYSVEK